MPDLTIESLPLYLVLIVPGFVAIKVYYQFVPGERPNFNNAVLEVITYSMINLGIMSWLVVLLNRPPFPDKHLNWYLVGHFVVLFVSPAILAVGLAKLQQTKIFARWVLAPTPTAWDAVFEDRSALWVICHLKNGSAIGGFYGNGSYASAFPRDQDIYISEVWKLDNYVFKERVTQTAGMLIRRSDCEWIEFFREP